MKKCSLLISLMFSLYSNAQNLINNPSLENLKPYPYVILENMWDNQFQESINDVDDGWFRAWKTPNIINEQLSEHIDYFDHYDVLDQDSLNWLEDQNAEFFFPARTGNQYAASHIYWSVWDHYKEIFGYELEQELEEGEEYCMRFHVKLGQGTVSGIDKIGALFHDERRQSGNNSEWDVWTSFTPQVMSPIGEPIIDSVNWTEISGSFIADGTEKYIYFGAFEYSEDLTIDTLGECFNWGHLVDHSVGVYFWDDFTLYKCGEETSPADAGKSDCIVLGDSIQLGSHDYEDYFYEWRVNDSVFSTEGMPWVSPDTTSIYGLYQQDFAFNETWSEVSVVVLQNPDDECVGLSVSEQFDPEIHMYPNPTSGVCRIESPYLIESIEVYTITGELIRKSVVNSKAYEVDIQSQAKGIYFVKMNVGEETVWKKILKE